jgi:hypothetical protein
LSDAVVVATWRKTDKGNSEVAPNEQSTPTSRVDIRRSADGNLEGFFDPATGKSYLIADNLTAASAPGTLMHEVGIHMAADGKLEPLFTRAANLLKMARDNAFIQRVQARMDESGETSNEEAAAYIVTEYEKDRTNAPASVGKWVKDFIADVRAWLFSKGVLLKADQLYTGECRGLQYYKGTSGVYLMSSKLANPRRCGTPEGFYYKGTVLFHDVVRVLFHEALGHFGLRGVFGKELKPLLQQIATMRKSQVEAKMKEYGLRGVSNVDRLVAAEEVLAEMAQSSPQIGFVRRAVATIKAWLRKNMFPASWA